MATKVHSAKPAKQEKKEKKPKRERVPKAPVAPAFFTGTQTPTHAKWPSMFKRHIGLIESHIKTLDRVMQSMKNHMDQMPEDERYAWESGEVGKWGVICGMMSRTRMILRDAREAGVGILPPNNLKEKKSLGAMGAIAEAYEAAKATRPTKTEPTPDASSSSSSSSEAESESDSDASTSSSESEEDNKRTKSQTPPIETPVFVPLQISKKRKLSDAMPIIWTESTEPNPYFVVDTKPTPVVLNGTAPSKKSKKKHVLESSGAERKSKKRSVDQDEETTGKKKSKKETPVPVAGDSNGVDFTEIEKNLQAEVDAGLKAAEAKSEKKEKKRKRISDGGASAELVVKKVKKEKTTKRNADGDAAAEESSKKKKRKQKTEE